MYASLLALHLLAIDSVHHVHLDPQERVIIDSRWGEGTGTVTLQLPLPPQATFDADPLEPGASMTVSLPLRAVQQLGALPLPLPQGEGVHRVTFDPALSFRAQAPLELSPRGTHSVGRRVNGADIRRIEERLGSATQGGAMARYVSTDEVRDAGGFTGRLQSSARRRQRLLLAAGGLFVLVVAALLAMVRRLRGRAEEEHADALLSREIEELAG